ASFGPFLPPFPDALETIEAVAAAGIAQAVASSSNRSRVDLALERSGLTGWFAAIVAGDQVERTKPAPDVYLTTAALLGAAPADCLAIEDSAHGCRAAIAAGMPVIGVVRVASERERLESVGAELVVDRVEAAEVLALLGAG
ncbi:MAG: HAD-IA family hydrolase, partial [Actinomycetota bacterium]